MGPAVIPAGVQRARVSKNVDGDTIWAEPLESGTLTAGVAHKIRLLEINSPEVKNPEVRGSSAQCYGPEASAFAKREIGVGSTVFLLSDKEDRDRFDRFLRYIWKQNGEFYNHRAVRLGFARAVLVAPNDLHIDLMRQAQAEAMANNRGLWGACESG